MNRTEFGTLMLDTFTKLRVINETKGRDYAGNEDALANFKRHAIDLNLEPEQIWAVYASKHWDAIMTYCREGDVASEAIDGRIEDALLYLFLLYGLVREKQQQADDTADAQKAVAEHVKPIQRERDRDEEAEVEALKEGRVGWRPVRADPNEPVLHHLKDLDDPMGDHK